MKDKITLNYDEYVALCNVINYLHDDELKHYEEALELGDGSNHIWHSVKGLSLLLKKYQMKENKLCSGLV